MSRPSIRPAIWGAIRALARSGQPISAVAVRDTLPGGPALERIRAYLRGLATAGYLAVVAAEDGGRTSYELVRDCGAEAPRIRLDGTERPIGPGRERMWHVMRVLSRGFSAADLAVHASVDGHLVAVREAQDYCQRLARCGYLLTLGGGRWRLNARRWRGPIPPQTRRDRTIHDPNTGMTYTAAGQEVRP